GDQLVQERGRRIGQGLTVETPGRGLLPEPPDVAPFDLLPLGFQDARELAHGCGGAANVPYQISVVVGKAWLGRHLRPGWRASPGASREGGDAREGTRPSKGPC